MGYSTPVSPEALPLLAISAATATTSAMSREQDDSEAKMPSRDLPSNATRTLEYGRKEATQSPKQVFIAPWRQQSTPIIVILGVLLVEAAAVGFGAVLVLHPIKLPLGSNIAPHLSVRSYNAIINLVSSVYAALVGISVAHGCRSHLGAKLVGRGVTLRQYEKWVHLSCALCVERSIRSPSGGSQSVIGAWSIASRWLPSFLLSSCVSGRAGIRSAHSC